MPIELPGTDFGPRHPVIRRQRIGETFIGALVKAPEARDILKDGKPVLKENGKPRQELVVTLVTMPGTTMEAGSSDDIHLPAPGDIVRTILRGKAYGSHIDADNALPGRTVGDVYTLTSDFGQKYDANGAPSGGELKTQAELDAVPRGVTLGVYGSLTIRRANPDEAPWVAQAEAAYHSLKQGIALDAGNDEDDPF